MTDQETNEKALKLHEEKKGKIEITSKMPLETQEDLTLAYTPGVAEPCRKIAENKDDVYKYTSKGNMIAVVTDGSAVLGLGNIGPEAGLPVMEGKAILFKGFADVDAFPICLTTQDPEEIIDVVKKIAPVFGAINLEDISAPRCFEIEERLKKELDIPVFHDDQHGTAIVVLAGLINSLKIVDKKFEEITVVISGAGAAGIAVAKILKSYGVKNIFVLDSKGVIRKGRDNLNKYKEEFCVETDKKTLADALAGADVFIGLSKPGLVTKEMVSTMNKDAVIFAMANPIPEIMPDEAITGGARIIATGRSDFPNQINNVLAFPGVLKGALKARKQITEKMKIAAAEALANYVKDPSEEKIIPNPLDKEIGKIIAEAVFNAA